MKTDSSRVYSLSQLGGLSKEAHPASIESARSKRASLSGSQDFTEQILTAFCTSTSLTTYFGDSNPFTGVAIKLNLHAHFASRQFSTGVLTR